MIVPVVHLITSIDAHGPVPYDYAYQATGNDFSMAKVLIASDDYVEAQALAAIASGEGHTVRTASDGYDALQIGMELQPDLVVLAANIAVFNGLETCDRFRGDPTFPTDLPILFLTSEAIGPRIVEKYGISEVLEAQDVTLRFRDVLVKHLGHKAGTEQTRDSRPEDPA